MVENRQSVAKLLRLQSVASYKATENVGRTTDKVNFLIIIKLLASYLFVGLIVGRRRLAFSTGTSGAALGNSINSYFEKFKFLCIYERVVVVIFQSFHAAFGYLLKYENMKI